MNQYVLRPMVYSIINPWSIHIIVRSNFTRNFVGQNSLNKLNKFHQTNPPFDSHSCIQSAIQREIHISSLFRICFCEIANYAFTMRIFRLNFTKLYGGNSYGTKKD